MKTLTVAITLMLMAGCTAATAAYDDSDADESTVETCDGSEVDLSQDPEHCGECGARCGRDQSCTSGECVCPEGTTRCGLHCLESYQNWSSHDCG